MVCVLLPEGPQTTGELATALAGCMSFSDSEEAESTLNSLISREPDPLVETFTAPARSERGAALLICCQASRRSKHLPKLKHRRQRGR